MHPILFQNHDLILYSYPLFMGLGWGLAYQRFFSKVDLPPKNAQFLFWGIFLSAWLGSKVFFIITHESGTKEFYNSSFWTGGGFVFYGGLVFSILFLIIYRLLRFPFGPHTLTEILSALTLGHAIGRLGCLLAGCCYGAATDWWWGIELHGHERHPTQVLEFLGLITLTYFLSKTSQTQKALILYLGGYGLLRFSIEWLRGDEIRGLWGFLTPSQWISLAAMAASLFLFFFRNYRYLALKQSK